MDLSNQKFFNKDFSKQDLRKVSMHHSEFVCCKFDDADMSNVDASYSKFVGGSMRRTKCTHTNFARTELNTFFEPSDCFGITLTLSCATFKGMTISRIWWYAWLYFACQMRPSGPEDYRLQVKDIIGKEKYARLESLFKREI